MDKEILEEKVYYYTDAIEDFNNFQKVLKAKKSLVFMFYLKKIIEQKVVFELIF